MLLRDYPEGSDLTLMNAMYTYPYRDDEGNLQDDFIDLVIKNNTTGEKFLRTIKRPDYIYYTAKPDMYLPYNLFFIEKENVDEKSVRFKDLLLSIAEFTGNTQFFYDNITNKVPKKNRLLHTCTNVFLSDMDIEDHYMFRFSNEYTNSVGPVTKAFFDIEADTIDMAGDFPMPGECPINAVSLIDDNANIIYIFLLRNEKNPLIEEFEKNINDHLKTELQAFIIDAVGGYKQARRLDVDHFDFKFFMYNEWDEILLIKDLFKVINLIKSDFVLAWNMAFDIPYIIQRIYNLGYDPAEIMCHPDFIHKYASYSIDEKHKNEYAERGDVAKIASYSVYIDQMIQFASRRKGQSAIRSFRLDDVGDMVAGVRKLDYKHITTDIGQLPYKDYKTFVFYNIMDTIVQKCIEKRTGDIDFMFNKAISNNTRYNKVHRQTTYLANRARAEFYKLGFIMGNNTNMNNTAIPYDGAFVADPMKTSDYSKLTINGYPVNVYNNLNDFDYARLYPSITQEFNMAPNTQYGKVMFPDQIDPNENKMHRGGWERQIQYMEDLQSGVYIEFCKRWLSLAGYDELIDDIYEYFETVRNLGMPINIFNSNGMINPFYTIPKGSLIRPFYNIENKIIRPFEVYDPLPIALKERLNNELANIRP